MKLKSILYKEEQEKILNKIINILELDNMNSIILYNLDNDKIKKDKILELIPEIRKYYSFNGIKAVGEPNKIKRPWLSIIKHLIKQKYDMVSLDYHFTEEGNHIRTQKYCFSLY